MFFVRICRENGPWFVIQTLVEGLRETISLFPLDRNGDLETSTVHRLMHVTLLLHTYMNYRT